MYKVDIRLSPIPTLPDFLSPTAQEMILRNGGEAIADAVRENFGVLNDRSNSRRYWKDAANSVRTTRHGAGYAVIISHKGVRLHWKGGTVRPTGKPSRVTGRPTKNLLIPFADSPLRQARQTLEEFTQHHGGYEIRCIPGKGGICLAAAKQGAKESDYIWLGKLVKKATHKPRPEVLPSVDAMNNAARAAMLSTFSQLMKKQ